MQELFFLSIFQLSAAIILIPIVGFLGSHTQRMGYVNFSNIEQEGKIGFNLVLRIFAPSVYITFLSIFLYFINTPILVKNIWLISLWYVIFNTIISILTGRFVLVNKVLYFGTHLFSIVAAYGLYVISFSKGLSFMLPESGNFRTELWFIIIGFFYMVLSTYEPDISKFYERKKKYYQSRYKFLRQKYQPLFDEDFLKNYFLEKIFFSIMITEDLNRNKLARFFERVLHPLGFIKTMGIMQVTSSKKMNDEDSIIIAKDKITKLYFEYKDKSDNYHALAQKIAMKYNPSTEYSEGVLDILKELSEQNIWEPIKIKDQIGTDNIGLPNIENIKDYREVLDLLEKLSNMVKNEVFKEKIRLNKEINNNK